jgi:hypothetical protein
MREFRVFLYIIYTYFGISPMSELPSNAAHAFSEFAGNACGASGSPSIGSLLILGLVGS